MSTIIVDDLDNAVNGIGQTVDLAAQLGIATGPAITPTVHGAVAGEAGITAGAVALQLGVAGVNGITWSASATPVNVAAGGGATLTAATGVVGATHARAIVTTPVAGGKATALVTV
jgi:hypothetical protein